MSTVASVFFTGMLVTNSLHVVRSAQLNTFAHIVMCT
jgi:hypothetical protein